MVLSLKQYAKPDWSEKSVDIVRVWFHFQTDKRAGSLYPEISRERILISAAVLPEEE